MSLQASKAELTAVNINKHKNAMYYNTFNNTSNRIDYVLVYKTNGKHEEIRQNYQHNLEQKHLKLEEYEDHERNLTFVKIHAEESVLKHYCEILKIRIPVKKELQKELKSKLKLDKKKYTKFHKILGYILQALLIQTKWINWKSYKITAEYAKHKEELFDKEINFSTSDRCMIVNFILERVKFKDTANEHLFRSEREKLLESSSEFGITKLLEKGVYDAAYPPHEGSVFDKKYERGMLVNEWASWSCFYKEQPLDKIKDYFGIKFALYFAWLGFYTHMLVPASILGIITVIYGILTPSYDTWSEEICNPKEDIIMCPQCDKNCDFWNITEACSDYKIRYYFENHMTVLLALCMSVWSALYLKNWKRYSAEITHKWGLTGFSLHAEHPRPEYHKCEPFCCRSKRHHKSGETFWLMRLPLLMFSYTVIIIMAIIVVGIISAISVYYICFSTSDYILGSENKYRRIFFIPITAALLNLIVINLLNKIYNWISLKLTNVELQRTQIEFDNNLQFKIYLFQFFNYYAPVFYIAFLKGNLIGYPARYKRIFGYRQQECEAGGCYMEVFFEVLTFMAAEQLWEDFMEFIWPFLRQFCKNLLKGRIRNNHKLKRSQNKFNYTEDYDLISWENTELLDEYLEMVIQYGFVTLFIVAFPLAPLLAFINNFFIELRLDATKFTTKYRRPIAQRVPDIGIWCYIMEFIGKISILTNACIIAFSTNFIPLIIYKINYGTTDGFLNSTLAVINVIDLENGTSPENSSFSTKTCRYLDYRYPPDHEHKYEHTYEYWYLLTAKLLFIIVYQNLVSLIVTIYQWFALDVPTELNRQIDDEDVYVMNTVLDSFEKDKQITIQETHHSLHHSQSLSTFRTRTVHT